MTIHSVAHYFLELGVNLKEKETKAVAPRENLSRRGLSKYTENPFLSATVVSTKTRRVTNKRGDMMLVSGETHRVIAPIAWFWHSEQVDSTKFVKLYINGVKAFRDLTNAGTRVFELLYLEVQKNIGRDVVLLHFAEVNQSITPMGKSTFMRGIRELLRKNFIAESTIPSKYFLNPDYLWNGDRLAFVKEYCLAPSRPILPSADVEESVE